MNALPLTIFVSLALAVFFVGMFLLQDREGGGNPRDALLPLEGDEMANGAGEQEASE